MTTEIMLNVNKRSQRQKPIIAHSDWSKKRRVPLKSRLENDPGATQNEKIKKDKRARGVSKRRESESW